MIVIGRGRIVADAPIDVIVAEHGLHHVDVRAERQDELERQLIRHGAQVELVSYLWDKPSLHFYSTVEPNGEGPPPVEWVEVSADGHVPMSDDPEGVAASIAACAERGLAYARAGSRV